MSDRFAGETATLVRLRCGNCGKAFLHQHKCRVTGAEWRRVGLTLRGKIPAGALDPRGPSWEYVIQ